MIKSTDYCDILKEASVENFNKDYKISIEKIYINEKNRNEIRFVYYKLNENKNYKLVVRPLDVTEDELYKLIYKAIEKEVLDSEMCTKIKEIINTTKVGELKEKAFNDTKYCKFYAQGSFFNEDYMCSIEQIFIKDLERREIRFAYYKKNKKNNYQLVPRPLDVTDEEFISMFMEGVKNGVFSNVFIKALETIL